MRVAKYFGAMAARNLGVGSKHFIFGLGWQKSLRGGKAKYFRVVVWQKQFGKWGTKFWVKGKSAKYVHNNLGEWKTFGLVVWQNIFVIDGKFFGGEWQKFWEEVLSGKTFKGKVAKSF